MAPEQFRGQAIAATDLYSLGATLVYLLTHHPPAELPHNNLKIYFRDRVQISHQFATWLDRLIEPNVTDRFASARLALTELRSHTFTTRESFKKLFETKLNLIAVGLIEIASISLNKIFSVYYQEENKIVELEKNTAQLCNSLELTQYYLNNGGDPNLIVDYSKTESNLLFCLLSKNNNIYNSTDLFKTTKLLIDAGVDLEARNSKNQTPLLYWLFNQRYGYRNNNAAFNKKIAYLLIDGGANINARDENQNTPLMLAVSYNSKDTEIAKKLIEKGAQINTITKNGSTPLSIVIE